MEPGRYAESTGKYARQRLERAKSSYDIETQRNRINSAIAKRIAPDGEINRAELERLSGRIQRVQEKAAEYQRNAEEYNASLTPTISNRYLDYTMPVRRSVYMGRKNNRRK